MPPLHARCPCMAMLQRRYRKDCWLPMPISNILSLLLPLNCSCCSLRWHQSHLFGLLVQSVQDWTSNTVCGNAVLNAHLSEEERSPRGPSHKITVPMTDEDQPCDSGTDVAPAAMMRCA